MYSHNDLAHAIAVPDVYELIPDPFPHSLLVEGIEPGSTVGIFVIDEFDNVKETLLLIKDIEDTTIRCRMFDQDRVIVRMRKRGMLPYESGPVRGSSYVQCKAVTDRMY